MRRILFVQQPGYLPRTIGGAVISLHALCVRLVPRGFDPVVICAPDSPAAAQGAAAPMLGPSYTILRVADPVATMCEMIGTGAPEAVVVSAPDPAERAAELAAAFDRRLHIYFESGFFNRSFPSLKAAPNLRYGANSPFLARMAQAYLGAPVAMIPPVIEPDEYRCAATGDAVMFVNPVAMKGVYIAAAIAERLSHRQFLFLRSWPNHPNHPHREIRRPNIDWADSTSGMRRLFQRTRLLLMPSVWEESSGRTLGEAQVSGIPCVASDRGGLRESVGPGGVVLSLADPIERWCEAVERIFSDPAHYAELSRGARLHAARPDYLPEAAVESFLSFIAS